MARFLVVVPPLTGHVNPTVSVGRELLARGHDVTWTGLPGPTEALLPPDLPFVAPAPAPATTPAGSGEAVDAFDEVHARGRGLRGAAALRFLWQDVLVPLAEAMVPVVERAVAEVKPDALLVDQQAMAGAIVARRHGIPWATSATTSAELQDPLADLPLVDRWVRDRLVALQERVGVPTAEAVRGDLRFSERLVLAFTTPALLGDREVGGQVVYVGPAFAGRGDDTPFPFDWLDPALPHVLVSLGTVNAEAGARFFAVAAEALAGEPLQAVVVAPPGTVETDAPNLLVVPRVPQVDLLPQLDAVVTHGGHNTVCESLAHGVPLVVAPIRDDQPIVAAQVVDAGAGVRVRFGRCRPAELRDAVHRALTDPALRAGARAVQASFAAAGGASLAADHLEELACDPTE